MISAKTAVNNLKLMVPATAIISSPLTFGLQAAERGILQEGTPVRVQLLQSVSSASAHLGERVNFRTVEDVLINGTVVIPKGSPVAGNLTEASRRGHMGKSGKLNINIDYVRLPDGGELALRGVEGAKGSGHTRAVAGATIAAGLICWPAAPVLLLIHGKNAVIPAGQQAIVYTDSDHDFAPEFRREAEASQGPRLRNADIITLTEAGFSDEVIVGKIKSSQGFYGLGVEDLVSLKAARVSDAVTRAMLDSEQAHSGLTGRQPPLESTHSQSPIRDRQPPIQTLVSGRYYELGKVLDSESTRTHEESGSITTGTISPDYGGGSTLTASTRTTHWDIRETELLIVGGQFTYVVDKRTSRTWDGKPAWVLGSAIASATHHGCRFVVEDYVRFSQDKGKLFVIDADGNECKFDIVRQERTPK
jgi:hypothetical protein